MYAKIGDLSKYILLKPPILSLIDNLNILIYNFLVYNTDDMVLFIFTELYRNYFYNLLFIFY